MGNEGKPSVREELAKRSRGLAPPDLVPNMRPGAVFLVDNAPVVFPASRLPTAGQATPHAVRPAIVMQATELCRKESPVTVLVVPCSTKVPKQVGPHDYAIPETEAAFPQPTVALASILQPLLKSELRSFCGHLSATAHGQLQAVIRRNLNLSAPSDFGPPRP